MKKKRILIATFSTGLLVVLLKNNCLASTKRYQVVKNLDICSPLIISKRISILIHIIIAADKTFFNRISAINSY